MLLREVGKKSGKKMFQVLKVSLMRLSKELGISVKKMLDLYLLKR
jgi:hypothetical protein